MGSETADGAALNEQSSKIDLASVNDDELVLWHYSP
jgi:hypothetical protein